MKQYLHGIRFKTIIVMLTISLLSTVMIGGWLYQKAAQVLKEEMKYSQLSGIESTRKYVKLILNDVDTVATSILLDKELQKAVCTPLHDISSFANYQNAYLVQEKLRGLKNVNEKIASIILFDQVNDRIFSTEFYGYLKASQVDALGYAEIRDLADSPKQWNVIQTPGGASGSHLISNRKHLTKGDGILFTFYINIDQKQFDALLNDMKGSPLSLYYMIDEEQQPIAFSQPLNEMFLNCVNAALPVKGQDKELEAEGEVYLAVNQGMEETDWTFVSLIPVSEVYGKLSQIRQLLVWICFIMSVIILFFGFYMNRLIYIPMKKLIETMNKNRSGSPVICDVAGQKDEFGEIASNFNQLIVQQHQLNQKLIQQEGLTKNAEIRFLQSQINPHFLYNILDTIHWMARMGKNEDVEKITLALSKFYRSSLNDGKELIPVAEALNMVQAYFDIQKVRFHNRIELITDIEESLDEVLVPKRIFQPIMENAINHGIAGSDRKGILLISGIDLGERVKFIIEDNGSGLTEEETKRVNEEIQKGDFSESGNYALKNLNSQIKMLYGEHYGLYLESSPLRGTAVTVNISKNVWRKEGPSHV